MKNNVVILLLSSAPGGVHNRSQLLAAELSKTHQVEIVYVYKEKPLSRLGILGLIKICKENFWLLKKADLVISFSLIPNLFSTLFAKTSIICPTGSCWHDKDARLISRIYWTFILEPLVYMLADAIVPASPTIIPSYAKSVCMISRKVHHIYGFIDYARLERSRQEADGRINKYLTEGYFLFLGSLTIHKGAPKCLHIYERARRIRPDLPPLLYCGAGPLASLLRRECLKLFCTSNHINCTADRPPVIFMDHLEDPYKIIGTSKLMLAPSYCEGLSNAILEGLYLSPALIATKHASNIFIHSKLQSLKRENTMYSDNLVLLPFPDSELLLDQWAETLINKYDETCGQMSSQSCIEIEEFSLKRNTGKWQSLIKNLVAS